MREEDILAIIPARAGSKRVTNKNLKELGGRPLLEWTVQAAMGSKYLDKIVLSTDSEISQTPVVVMVLRFLLCGQKHWRRMIRQQWRS